MREIRNIEIQRPKKEEIQKILSKTKYFLKSPFLFFIYINIVLYFLFILKLIFIF